MQTPETQTPAASGGRESWVRVTPEMIRAYLAALAARGRQDSTVLVYGANLRLFYSYLPPDKRVTRETIPAWRDSLLAEGYSCSTVNVHLTVANGLMDFLGRRDLQVPERLDALPEVQPELTRAEYLRLLAAARALGRERTYLMVKVFALTGIRVGELSRLTAEAVEDGRLPLSDGGERRAVPIPRCLRQELLRYVRRQGIRDGPVFVTRSGKPPQRTQVTAEIQALGRDARVEEAKSNPRCLRKLYQGTQAKIGDSVRLLAEQSYERLLDTEQLAVGWDEAPGGGPGADGPAARRENGKTGGSKT